MRVPRVLQGRLNHTKWECKFHARVYTKGQENAAAWAIAQAPREDISDTGVAKGVSDRRGRLMPDHVNMMISISPKYAVSQVVGYIKGKSAIHLARVYAERKRNFVGQSFWARGYFVSTVGRDEQVIRNYIRHQEKEDERLEQLGL